jgi:hypothetical protein
MKAQPTSKSPKCSLGRFAGVWKAKELKRSQRSQRRHVRARGVNFYQEIQKMRDLQAGRPSGGHGLETTVTALQHPVWRPGNMNR